MELDDETLEMLLLLLLADGEGQMADELMEAVNRALPALPAKPESEELDECRRTPWRDLHAGRVTAMASPFRRTSLHRVAAVYHHGVADHEGGRIRAQPEDSRGDLLGLAHPSGRHRRDQLRAPFGRAPGEATHHRGVGVAGTDGVDADVLRGVVECRRAGEADHAVLRGSVRGAALDADDPCARGCVDDRAASLLEDQRDLVLHAQEDAVEVG